MHGAAFKTSAGSAAGGTIVIAVSGYLIKLGVGYVLSVKWALLAIAGIILLAVAGIRLYRYHRHTNNWRDGDEGF